VGGSSSGGRIGAPFINATLSECIRLLDVICLIDGTRTTKAFTIMKRLADRLERGDIFVYLGALSFYANHSWADAAVFDPLPAFRTFFEDCLPEMLPNPIVAFEVLHYFTRFRDVLRARTSIFSVYFPALFKVLAWHCGSISGEFIRLLPSLLQPGNFLEMCHIILDLPLTTAVLERAVYARRGEVDMLQSHFRVLLNHLLRNEGGVGVNFWSNVGTQGVLLEFFRLSLTTFRVEASCEVALHVLNVFVDLIAERAPLPRVVELTALLIERADQLYPLESYVRRFEAFLCDKMVLLVGRWPALLELLADTVSEYITLAGKSHIEFFTALCWCVGEYGVHCGDKAFSGYIEALELYMYERISFAKLGLASLDTKSLNSRTPLRTPFRGGGAQTPSGGTPYASIPSSAGGSTKYRRGGGAATPSAGAPMSPTVLSPQAPAAALSSSSSMSSLAALIAAASAASPAPGAAVGAHTMPLAGPRVSASSLPDIDVSVRPMVVAMSALAKLAAHKQEHVSRVALCMSKLIGHADLFPPEVGQQASEFLNLLRFPSVASVILAQRATKDRIGSHLDTASPLPFLVVPVSTTPALAQPLHEFDLLNPVAE
jgi:hypothetical protein